MDAGIIEIGVDLKCYAIHKRNFQMVNRIELSYKPTKLALTLKTFMRDKQTGASGRIRFQVRLFNPTVSLLSHFDIW